MKNTSKRTISTLLAVVLVFSLLTAMPITASAEAPGAPTNLTATVHFTLIVLVWEDNSTGEAGFQIERKENGGSWETLTSVDADWEIYHDKEVNAGKTYSYRVRAVYTSIEGGETTSSYSGYSNEASGTIDFIPAPTLYTPTAGTNGITLSWMDNSSNEDGFMIIKSWAGGLMGDTFKVGANIVAYIDNDVIAEYEYTYEVIAYADVPASLLEMGMNNLYSERSNAVTVTAYVYMIETTSASMSNFVGTRLYSPGIFTDVNENMWYGYEKEKVVMLAYEYDLMSGNTATTFNPTGNLTIAEAITVATRIHCIYTTGHKLEFDPIPDAPWFQGNVNYAIDNGIIDATIFSDYRLTATRAEMAYIFAHALPDYEYQDRYDVNSPPDVSVSTPYYDEIMMLYRAGIVGGDEGTGAFRPGNNITRVEAAAIVSRLVVVNSRLGYDYYYPGFTS